MRIRMLEDEHERLSSAVTRHLRKDSELTVSSKHGRALIDAGKAVKIQKSGAEAAPETEE